MPSPIPRTADTSIVPTANDLVIRRFLDLSTSHLDHATAVELSSYEGVTACSTPTGWLMYAPDRDDIDTIAQHGDWPPELAPIIILARKHGCAYVLFDEAADTTELLPTFDW